MPSEPARIVFKNRHTISSHRAAVTSLIYNDNGTTLFSGSADGSVAIHSVCSNAAQTPTFKTRLQRPTATGVNSLAWLPDKLLVASDDCATLWDLNAERPLFSFTDHTLPVTDCDAYENYLLTASADETLSLIDIRQGKPISMLRGHTGAVLAARLLPKMENLNSVGPCVVSGGVDGLIKLWNPIQGNAISVTKPGKPVATMEISPNSRYILCSQVDMGATLQAIPTDPASLEIKQLKRYARHESKDYLLPANYLWTDTSEQQMILCGTSKNELVAYNVKRDDQIASNVISLPSPPLAIASSSTAPLIGIGCMDTRIHLFSVS